MPPKNPKAATPAEVGPQEIRRVGDKKGIAKIRREVRKQREKAVFTKILQEVAQETAVAEICRQLGKRKSEKAVFTKYWQEMERGDITDEKINRAWNEYQLARALREAYYERERFRSAHREFKELADSLAAINRGEEITEPAPTKASADRGAAKAALDAVLKFLHRPGHKISVRQRFDSAAVLYRHRIDLDALDHGITPLALKAERKKGGRKRDSAIVQQLKGSLAGIARLQMESGLSRRAAAALVARRIPRPLASRLSSKGFITSRTVLQYMDQYDCGATLLKKFEQPSEREKFKTIFGYREGNDDGSLRQFRAEGRHLLRQINFLKENTPKRKLSGYRKGVWKQANPLTALFGFAREMHLVASARAEGYWPSCDDLFEDLGAFLIASDQ